MNILDIIEKKKNSETLEYIWKDRKRILGMPISFTKYSLTEDRLFCETGLLNSKYEEIILYRIKDLSLKRTLGQKIFGVGSVFVVSSDMSLPNLEIKNVKNAFKVKELLHEQVEKIKIARRVRVSEMSGMCDHDADDELVDDIDF